MKFSIIIATADRPEMVLDCIRSFRDQIHPEVEVVIVDAGTDKPVDEKVVRSEWKNSQVVKSSIRNAAAQRNTGVRQAKGDIVIFLDDDVLVQPGWWPGIIEPLLVKSEGEYLSPAPPGARVPEITEIREEKMRQGLQAEPEAHAALLNGEQEETEKDCLSQRTKGEEATRNFPGTESIGRVAAGGNLEELIDQNWSLINSDQKMNSSLRSQRALREMPPPIAAVAGAVWVNPAPEFTDERGGYVNLLGEPVQVTHRSEKAPREVDWALTTNMAVRKDVYIEVGGIVEVFGIYDEDVDLGLKIRRALYRIVFQPGSAVYHYYLKRGPKQVTMSSEFRLGRNRSMMLVRNFGLFSRVWLFLVTSPWIRLWSEVVYSKKRALLRLPYLAAYVAGTWEGVVDGLRHPVSQDKM